MCRAAGSRQACSVKWFVKGVIKQLGMYRPEELKKRSTATTQGFKTNMYESWEMKPSSFPDCLTGSMCAWIDM